MFSVFPTMPGIWSDEYVNEYMNKGNKWLQVACVSCLCAIRELSYKKGKNEDDSGRQISLQVKPGGCGAGDGVD